MIRDKTRALSGDSLPMAPGITVHEEEQDYGKELQE